MVLHARFSGAQSARSLARFLVFVAVSLTVAGATVAHAQDSQSWYQSYGNRGRLLGGLTIGGGGDISAVFYNPGRIAFGRSREILLSANTYELQDLKYVNRSELEGDIQTSTLAASPSLVAGDFGGRGESPTRFAYAILSRQSFSTDLRYRGDLEVDSLATIGSTSFRAGVRSSARASASSIRWARSSARCRP